MKTLNIQTNVVGQRFLVIDDFDYFISIINDLPQADFDAFYLDLGKGRPHLHIEMMQAIRVSYNGLLYLYPIFAPTWLAERLPNFEDKSLFDGFSDSLEDEHIKIKAADILNVIYTFKSIRYNRFVRSVEVCAIQILRYYYSRSMDIMPTIYPEALYGYSTPLILLFTKTKLVDIKKLIRAFDNLVEKGYLESFFFDRVHLCPKCNSIHLIYRETCVKCGSSNLRDSKMIHHFVCANVAPEEDYLQDNLLVCPKCHRELRHIGVDYDRPSDIFNCNDCGTSFLHPKMVAHCMTCGQENDLNKLETKIIRSYKLTSQTYEFIRDPNPFDIESAANVAGFYSLEAFIEQTRTQIYFLEEKDSKGFLSVLTSKTTIKSTEYTIKKDMEAEVLEFIAKRLIEQIHSDIQIRTYRKNVFFTLFVNAPQEEIQSRWKKEFDLINVEVKREYGEHIVIDQKPNIITYRKGDNQDDFIIQILNTK